MRTFVMSSLRYNTTKNLNGGTNNTPKSQNDDLHIRSERLLVRPWIYFKWDSYSLIVFRKRVMADFDCLTDDIRLVSVYLLFVYCVNYL